MLLGWCLIAPCRRSKEVESLSFRLSLTARVQRVLVDQMRLLEQSDRLTAASGLADAADILDFLAPEAVWAAAVKGGALGRVCREYLSLAPASRPLLNGTDLLAAGVPSGPEVGRILRLLRRARLEGRVDDRNEEIALVRRETGNR